jgi:hypothetical protein
MSYANWNATAFYNADDIVVYSGEDYQALLANHDVVPVGNPLTWNPIAPPGPGPSNQLAFTQATTDLSIVGGNTIDISPKLVYSGSSDPTTNALSVGNTNVLVPTTPLLTFSETTTGVLPRPIIFTIVDDPAPPPANPPPYRLVEAQYIKNAGEVWKFYIDVIAGSPTLGSEFTTGGVGAGMVINAEPLLVQGSNGPTQLRLRDVVNASQGDLWVNPTGTLMWNQQMIGPPESGIATLISPALSIPVATTTTLTATPIISINIIDDGSVPFSPQPGDHIWYTPTGPNSFTINITGILPGSHCPVAWSILRP